MMTEASRSRVIPGCSLFFHDIAFALLLMVGLLSLTGCVSRYTPVFQISLHQFAGEELADSRIKTPIRDPLTEQMREIYRNSFLDSRRMVKGEVKEDPKSGRYGIVIHVDRFGVSTLLHLSGEMPGDPFAVIIDGFFVGTGRFPKRVTNGSMLELPPIWSKREATVIVEHIEKNYTHYNKRFAW